MLDRRPAARPGIRKLGLRVVAALERQSWLDRPSYRFEHVLTFVFAACGAARGRITNAMHGSWLGHPVHPVLTSVPTGAIAATVALDVASVLPHDGESLRNASRAALGVGILGSLGALATGVTDWQYTHEQARRIGIFHGTLNLVATSLYVVSWRNRRQHRQFRAASVSALGYGLMLASGYLGGELVYGYGVGVDHSGARPALTTWTPLLPVHMLPKGRPQRVQIDGAELLLYRDGDRVLAFGTRCPHLGAPMCDGWIDRGCIVCPWHGSRFSLNTGEVLRGPATAHLPCYPARITDGMIELRNSSPDGVTQGVGAVK